VPVLIGINWFMIIFCATILIKKTHEYFLRKMPAGAVISASMRSIAFIIDAALLATFFDWLMEPAAIKLGYWQWLPNGNIPVYNYVCWFCISAFLFAASKYFSFNRHNQFAVHLFIIQLLFFLILRTFICSGVYI
jgi:putative membrane protein